MVSRCRRTSHTEAGSPPPTLKISPGSASTAANVARTLEAVVKGGPVPPRDVPFLRSFVTGPNPREVDSQFRKALSEVDRTLGEARDGEAPQKPGLLRLSEAAKGYKKMVDAARAAGEVERVLTLERAFLAMYRTATEEE